MSPDSALNKFRYLLIFLLAALALVFDRNLTDTFEIPKSVVLWVGSFALTTAFFWKTPPSNWRYHPMLAAFGAMLLLFLPSLTASVDLYASLMGNYSFYFGGLISWISFFLLFFLTLNLNEPSSLKKFFWAAITTGLIISIYAAIQTAGLDPWVWASGSWPPFSFLGNSLYLGAFMAMLIPLVIALLLEAKQSLTAAACLLILGLFCYLMLQTLTRSAWLGSLVGIALFCWFAGFKKLWRQRARLALILIPFSLVLAWCLFLGPVLQKQPSSIQNRFKVFLDPTEGSASARMDLWLSAFRIFWDHPFVGVGLDNFQQHFWKYRTPEHARLTGERAIATVAHNDTLQILSTTGLLGFCGWLLLLLQGACLILRLRKTLNEETRTMAGALAASLAGLGIFGQFNFSGLVTSAWAGVFLGALVSLDAAKLRPMKLPALPQLPWRAALGGLLTLATLALTPRGLMNYAAELAYLKGNVLATQIKTFDKAEYYLASAIELNPHVRYYHLALGRALTLRGDAEKKDKQKKAHYYKRASSVFEEQVRMLPWSAIARNNLAVTYLKRAEEFDEPLIEPAKRLMEEAMMLGPVFSNVYDRYGETLFKQGKIYPAKRIWEMVIGFDPDFIATRKNLERFRPDEYVYFYNQEVRVQGALPGSRLVIDDLRLVNDLNRPATIELKIAHKGLALYGDINHYQDIGELGWVQIKQKLVEMPANTIEPIVVEIKIPRWPWWRGKKFVVIIEAKDKNVAYPFGRFGRILIETKE